GGPNLRRSLPRAPRAYETPLMSPKYLTDVVMPMMSGFELGRRLTERTFGLKILYMSGYRENNSSGTPGETPIAFLHKPFTPDALLAKVREVLDGASV